MADIVDLAGEREISAEALAAHQSKMKKQEPVVRGFCLSCNAPLEKANAIYCDSACREDHEHEQRILSRTTGR